jgi:hypothetical protein
VWRRVLSAALVWAVGLTGMRVFVVPPERCSDPGVRALAASATAGADWLVRVQRPDGTYLYDYDRATDTELPGYNVVRHAGVTMSLYQLAAGGDLAPDASAGGAAGPTAPSFPVDPSVVAAADRGLDWMIDNVVRHGDRANLGGPDENPKLGATALMLAGLAQRRLATVDPTYDELMHELARGMLGQQRPDGSMLNLTDRATGEPVPDVTSLYSTGEAFWALTLMHELFPDAGYDGPARDVATYIATDRDDDEDVTHQPWADQWSAYAFAEMADWGLDAVHVTYLRELIDRFGVMTRGEAQRHSGGPGRWLRGGEARGAGFGTVVEAMGSFWRLTAVAPELAGLHDTIGDRLHCSAGILVDRQQDAADASQWPNPELVEGAWYLDDATRMDDQQHAVSGVARAVALAEERGDA